jgi:serine/threonine-protein kinase RsbW
MDKPKILPDGIVIPSSTSFLADVDQYLEDKLAAAGIDSSTIADVAISVSELVNNAIVHGNKRDITKRVDVRLAVSSSEVRVVVCDQGNGFDLTLVKDPIEDDNLLREVGRGLFIVRNFVNEVRVTPAPSGGTCVEIVKKR